MQREFKTISIIGLGYIGLPTAAVLASRGIDVIGVDVNENAVNTINEGKIHIVEPELDMIVHAAVTSGRLRATLKAESADAFLIAVPTPFKGDHEPDLSYVKSSIGAIAEVLKKNDLVILESTSPVGTTEKMSEWLAQERPDLSFPHQTGENADVQLAYCPERVLPGKVVKELVENDRVVGGLTDKCAQRAVALYNIFVDGECIITNARTAEMAKLTENSFRDVNIAFANELSILCDKFGINVWELIKLSNRHPRVNILQPGPGVGGHCIAVDPWFIVHAGGQDAKIIRAAREVNNFKTEWAIEKVKNAALVYENKHGRRPKIACMGLAFKPDIDDLRESPSLYITKALMTEGLDILAVEPNIENHRDFEVVECDEAVAESDLVVFLVAHKDFSALDVSDKEVIDFCGILTS